MWANKALYLRYIEKLGWLLSPAIGYVIYIPFFN